MRIRIGIRIRLAYSHMCNLRANKRPRVFGYRRFVYISCGVITCCMELVVSDGLMGCVFVRLPVCLEYNYLSFPLSLSMCVCGSVCQRYVHMQMLLEFQWDISSYRSCELSIMYALTHRFGTIYLTTIAMWQNYNAFAEKHDYACYIYMMGSEPPGITYPYLLPTHIHKY